MTFLDLWETDSPFNTGGYSNTARIVRLRLTYLWILYSLKTRAPP